MWRSKVSPGAWVKGSGEDCEEEDALLTFCLDTLNNVIYHAVGLQPVIIYSTFDIGQVTSGAASKPAQQPVGISPQKSSTVLELFPRNSGY